MKFVLFVSYDGEEKFHVNTSYKRNDVNTQVSSFIEVSTSKFQPPSFATEIKYLRT